MGTYGFTRLALPSLVAANAYRRPYRNLAAEIALCRKYGVRSADIVFGCSAFAVVLRDVF
jgi:hypothetical protein